MHGIIIEDRLTDVITYFVKKNDLDALTKTFRHRLINSMGTKVQHYFCVHLLMFNVLDGVCVFAHIL